MDTPTLKWSQCDCAFATQGIVCKHVMKIFKMLHPNIGDGSIVRKTNTLHGVVWFLKHNRLECGLGEVGTRDDDPNYKHPNQKINLKLKDHLESTTNEDVIDIILFFIVEPQLWNFQPCIWF
jgi:hypothetical protein